MLGTGDTAVNPTGNNPCLHGAHMTAEGRQAGKTCSVRDGRRERGVLGSAGQGVVFLNRVGRAVLAEKVASDRRGPGRGNSNRKGPEVGPRLARCIHGPAGRPL